MAGIDLQPLLALPQPQTLEETGLKLDLIVQLLLKAIYYGGELTGVEFADRLGLTFSAVQPGIDALKEQHFCEIVGGTSLGPPSYRYRITVRGRERASLFLEQNMYSGVAPVPLDQYLRYMASIPPTAAGGVTRAQVMAAFGHLVLSDRIIDQLGPAINAGHSLFVYGAPGNGKSVISQAIRNLLLGEIYIPHALEVNGNLIQIFDPVNHEPLPPPSVGTGLEALEVPDRRWVRCRRPLVTVGGELTLDSLDLIYNPTAGFYRAPIQLLSNGGVLVIDDFGRQRCSPHALLNRWIVALEARIDYLTLQSGQKVALPFLVFPVFATNLKPAELVDEAFLRRIQYKVMAESPTAEDYSKIFENVCKALDVPFDQRHVDYLLDNVYAPRKIAIRGCQPRDLINQALMMAQFRGEPRRLSVPLLDSACATYFIDEEETPAGN
jgi:hypothetical protein